MQITPDAVLTTLEFTEADQLHRIEVKGEKVFDFDLSQHWTVRYVSVTKDRRIITITLEREREKNEAD